MFSQCLSCQRPCLFREPLSTSASPEGPSMLGGLVCGPAVGTAHILIWPYTPMCMSPMSKLPEPERFLCGNTHCPFIYSIHTEAIQLTVQSQSVACAADGSCMDAADGCRNPFPASASSPPRASPVPVALLLLLLPSVVLPSYAWIHRILSSGQGLLPCSAGVL